MILVTPFFVRKEIEVDRSYFFNDFLPRMDVNKFDAILSGICGIIEKVVIRVL